MINRSLIRIRVFQELFAYFHTAEKDLKQSENQMLLSLFKTHDLYFHLMGLLPALTDLQANLQELRKGKYFKTEEDINPNMRLVNNRLTAAIRASEALAKFQEEKGNIWFEESILLRTLLNEIVASKIYTDYKRSEDNLEEDVRFWASVLAKHTFKNEDLDEFLDQTSIYWDSPATVLEKIEVEERPDIDEVDDIVLGLRKSDSYRAVRLSTAPVDVQKEFLVKTFRSYKGDTLFDEVLMPRFRDEEDVSMGVELLRATIVHADEYRELIDECLKNWEMERVADVDMIILMMALAELLSENNIPTTVTLNEYIELAKTFSTPESGKFVNGILDAALSHLRKEGRILKK